MGALEKTAWIIFGLAFLITFYVHSTTNRLYREDVRELLLPIYQGLLIIQLVCVSTIIINDYRQHRILIGLKFLGVCIAVLACVIELFDFAPCLFKHSSSNTDHSHPHTLAYTLKQSFFCPSFSHSSRLMLIFMFGIGSGLTVITYVIEKKKPVANNT